MLSNFIHEQKGLTLIEMVATIVLMGILMAMTIGALSYYFAGRSLDVAAREITTQIREAQALALASGNRHRINLGETLGSSYELQRQQGNGWVTVRGPLSLPGGTSFSSADVPESGDNELVIQFYARGTSDDGQMVLEGRYGRTRTIDVEGETVNIGVI